MATTDPHSSPHAKRLALKLVEEQYGEVCKGVVGALLSHGVQTFPDLLRTSGLPAGQLKNALLVLIQQNCVNSYFQQDPPTLRGPGPAYQLYEAATDRILQSIRAPRFLTHIRDEMGDLAELVVHKLLAHGRLRAEQLISAVQSDNEQQATEEGERERTGNGPPATELHATFVSLVKARYVERLHPNARKKKPSLKTASEEEDAAQRRQADALQRQAYQQERFKLPADLAAGMGLDEAALASAAAAGGEEGDEAAGGEGAGSPEGDQGRRGRGRGKAAAGGPKRKRGGKAIGDVLVEDIPAAKKRSRKKVKADEEVAQQGEDKPGPASKESAQAAGTAAAAWGAEGEGSGKAKGKGRKAAPSKAPEPALELTAGEVLWRVNYEEFNRRFRNEAVVALVNEKHGAETAAVMAAMLLANARFEAGVQIDKTAVLSEADVSGAARRLNTEEYKLPHDIGEVLSVLEVDDLEIVESAGRGPGGNQYTVDVNNALRAVRLLQIQSVIRERFGHSGMRIWRAVLFNKQLEQKQVADFAMMAKEEARQLLYKMVRAGYVSIQDVPRTADHAPSRTFYTFHTDLDLAAARLSQDLYRAAGNVHARLAHELGQHREVLELLELVSSGQAPRSVLAQREEELGRVKQVATLLESSLLHLDHLVAIFNDM
ncbi:hypothetical protein N2152v2_001827 [Parachlorella kessleri]